MVSEYYVFLTISNLYKIVDSDRSIKRFMFVTKLLHMNRRRDVFQAIADPNRRAIIALLSRQRLTLNSVAENFKVSRPAISKHIKILAECGLIQIKQEGRERFCQANLGKLKQVSDWTEQYKIFWTDKLDALGVFLSKGPVKKR